MSVCLCAGPPQRTMDLEDFLGSRPSECHLRKLKYLIHLKCSEDHDLGQVRESGYERRFIMFNVLCTLIQVWIVTHQCHCLDSIPE